jgi:hypothetical protein
MLDGVKNLRERLTDADSATTVPDSSLRYLRAATAQLLLATGAGATLEHASGDNELSGATHPSRTLPRALVWAPALIGSVAAVANLEHARDPSERTSRAVLFLNVASLAAGSALLALDMTNGQRAHSRLAPLAFASAAIMGITLGRYEREARVSEAALRRRAAIVERLVPKRKARLDKVVVHV